MPDNRIQADFTIQRNERKFVVRFSPVKGAWWNVSIHESNGHLLKHVQRKFPPNFTNAMTVLDEWVPENAAPKKRPKKQPRLKVVG